MCLCRPKVLVFIFIDHFVSNNELHGYSQACDGHSLVKLIINLFLLLNNTIVLHRFDGWHRVAVGIPCLIHVIHRKFTRLSIICTISRLVFFFFPRFGRFGKIDFFLRTKPTQITFRRLSIVLINRAHTRQDVR